MSTILTEILNKKYEEVKALKENGFDKLNQNQDIAMTLYDSLKNATTLQVISEIKRASPSKGDINIEVDPLKQAKLYESSGVSAISVLTDESYFKGSISDLAAVRKVVSIPILCKDFIVDEIQIDRALDAGANIILLIVAALSQERLQELYTYATSKGLEVLVEVHDEEEMKIANHIEAKIIGINNRNLKTFEVNLSHTETLSKLCHPRAALISESGIRTEADCERVAQAGVTGILVGETLMRSQDVKGTIDGFQTIKVGSVND